MRRRDIEAFPVKQHEPERAGDGKSSQRREDGHAGFSAEGRGHGHQEQADERRKPGENRLVGHRGETQAQVSQGRQQRDLRHRRLAGQDEPSTLVHERENEQHEQRDDRGGIGRRLPAGSLARRGTPSPRLPPGGDDDPPPESKPAVRASVINRCWPGSTSDCSSAVVANTAMTKVVQWRRASSRRSAAKGSFLSSPA